MKLFITLTLCMSIQLCIGQTLDRFIHEERTVRISGQIKDYKQIYKSGKLTYYDAVSRKINNNIFHIDSSGHFEVVFEIPHPILSSIYFDIEDQYFTSFYIEPGIEYEVEIQGSELVFVGISGDKNRAMKAYYKALHGKFEKENDKLSNLHLEGLTIAEYLKEVKQYERSRLVFLSKYLENQNMDSVLIQILEDEIRYKSAHSWINYRFEYLPNSIVARKNLPDRFYEDLFTQYPLRSFESCYTLNGINYISNLSAVLKELNGSVHKRIEFYKRSKLFTSKEIEILTGIYNQDKEVFTSKDFEAFNTTENQLKESKLAKRYELNLLSRNLSLIKDTLAQDLVLSQTIYKNFYSVNDSLSAYEWNEIEGLFSDKSILDYIKSFDSNYNTSVDKIGSIHNGEDTLTVENIKEKYIYPFAGKVVYIDFYATWCGPCRTEIPFARILHREFEKDNVVFLNLCAESTESNWVNMIRQYDIKGENFLLDTSEFAILSKLYKVKGFPTYVLINTEGEVVSYSASRPSSKSEIINKIRALLTKRQ